MNTQQKNNRRQWDIDNAKRIREELRRLGSMRTEKQDRLYEYLNNLVYNWYYENDQKFRDAQKMIKSYHNYITKNTYYDKHKIQ